MNKKRPKSSSDLTEDDIVLLVKLINQAVTSMDSHADLALTVRRRSLDALGKKPTTYRHMERGVMHMNKAIPILLNLRNKLLKTTIQVL